MLLLSGMLDCVAHAQLGDYTLEVGRPLPEIRLSEVEGYSKESLMTSELKGKWLILDFFTSSCAACFKSLPLVNEFQKQYESRIRFVMVGLKDDRIKEVYNRFKTKFDLKLTVAYDSILFKRLKIDGFPYLVWVDNNGVIRAITGKGELTQENILAYLHNQRIAGATEKKEKIPFNPGKRLAVGNGLAHDSSILFRSLLTQWDQSMSRTYPPRIDWSEPQGTFQVLGASLATLYKYAYFGVSEWTAADSLYGKYSPEIVFDRNDTNALKENLTNGNEFFCYSVSVPIDKFSKEYIEQLMRADLKTNFGYSVRVEDRMKPYWSLKATKNAIANLKANGRTKQAEYTHAGFSFSNIPVSQLVSILQIRFQKAYPFIDETGITTNIDIGIRAVLTDFDEVKKSLGEKGLNLVLSKRLMKVLVLIKES